MSRKKCWSWASRAELDPALDLSELWVNPRLPAPERRWRQPFRVEVSVLEEFACTLEQLERLFGDDSTLAAIMRNVSACHFLIYTGAGEAESLERCRAVRERLRLSSMGHAMALEPGWHSVLALDDATLPATMSPWIADRADAWDGSRGAWGCSMDTVARLVHSGRPKGSPESPE